MPDPNHTYSHAPKPVPDATHTGADPAAMVNGPDTVPIADTLPELVGRYELGEEIARGGMGAVYRATDTAFQREVAVKVLLDKFEPQSGTARRFADEARITGQLQHPAIPPVHDVGTLPDGRPFLAMKLIKGRTLADLLASGGRESPELRRGSLIAVFEQVCQGLAYAHAHHVIHRDLKPANVMVGNFGEVQVMDWGLAKVLGSREADSSDPEESASGTAIQSQRESDDFYTPTGSVMGTPEYMPPEQAIGQIHMVDARSDVFGLGGILAAILTGKPPFLASSVQTTRLKAAQWDVEECFARIDACGAEPELVALGKRCLARRPDDRPSDAGEVAKAVTALRAAADERARQAELDRVKAAEQRKRRKVQLLLVGAVVGLVAAAGFGVMIAALWREAEHHRGMADAGRVEEGRLRGIADKALGDALLLKGVAERAQKAEAVERKKADDARDRLAAVEYGRTMEVAHQNWRDNNLAAARALLEGTNPKLRGWEYHYLHRLCHAELLTLKGHTSYVQSASLSPDGRRIVTGSWDNTAKVWDAATGAELLTFKGGRSNVFSASFSPDGYRIVTGWEFRAIVWDSRPFRETLPPDPPPATAPAPREVKRP